MFGGGPRRDGGFLGQRLYSMTREALEFMFLNDFSLGRVWGVST